MFQVLADKYLLITFNDILLFININKFLLIIIFIFFLGICFDDRFTKKKKIFILLYFTFLLIFFYLLYGANQLINEIF